MNDTITLVGKIKHCGYGYEITETGDVKMRVGSHDLREGDVVVSTSIEFGELKSAVIVRPFKNVEIVPICLASST